MDDQKSSLWNEHSLLIHYPLLKEELITNISNNNLQGISAL